MSPSALLLLGALLPTSSIQLPFPVRGAVVAVENGQGLAGARVQASRSGYVAETDRRGRFIVWLNELPDTLIVRMIGRWPDTLVLTAVPAAPISIVLGMSPTAVAGITVYGVEGIAAISTGSGTWTLPRAVIEAVPFVVEADVLRSLALAPAVAFSTPLSSQPLVRGQDGGAVSVRLDGFTLLNPYHIGRYLGVIAPSAVQGVTVVTGPVGETWGDATSGIVDVHLREGGSDFAGGVQLSLATASVWAGGPAGGARWFVAARHAYFGDLPIAALRASPYSMDDVYGRFTIPVGRLPVHVTAFLSRDRIFNRETGDGMRWGSRLVGARLPVSVGGDGRLEVWGEVSAFDEDVVNLPLRGSTIDIRNEVSTAATGARLEWTGARRDVRVGLEARRRRMANVFTNGFLPPPDVDDTRWSGAGFAALDLRWSRLAAHAGVRVEGDASGVFVQPTARVSLPLGGASTLHVAAGRSTMLYHLISDPQPEPEPFFYDIWRPASREAAPHSVADHALVELRHGAESGFHARVGLFAGWLRGVGEVEPDLTSAGGEMLRFGRGRLRGLEIEVSHVGTRVSGSVAYALSRSERRWPETARYVPWVHDRRHQIRATAAAALGRGWRVTTLVDVSSPEPLTPVIAVAEQGFFTPVGTVLDTFPRSWVMVPGEENSARGVWVGRADLALNKAFTWGRARGTVGLSILNFSFTRVTPIRPRLGGAGVGLIEYQPIVGLPPIPTVSFRLEF